MSKTAPWTIIGVVFAIMWSAYWVVYTFDAQSKARQRAYENGVIRINIAREIACIESGRNWVDMSCVRND